MRRVILIRVRIFTTKSNSEIQEKSKIANDKFIETNLDFFSRKNCALLFELLFE